jgi:hypothetical protein
MFTKFSLILISETNSRYVPRVERVWLAHAHPKHSEHHRQREASLLTAKLDLAPPLSQSPSHVNIIQCLSEPASCALLLACFPKNITRACGVNSRALFTHPQTKPRALNTAPTPPNPLQNVPAKNVVMWNTEKYAARYERLSNTQAWRSK